MLLPSPKLDIFSCEIHLQLVELAGTIWMRATTQNVERLMPIELIRSCGSSVKPMRADPEPGRSCRYSNHAVKRHRVRRLGVAVLLWLKISHIAPRGRTEVKPVFRSGNVRGCENTRWSVLCRAG